MNTAALWLGDNHAEARSAYHRAREAGMSVLRALVVGSIASFKDCWAFRRKLASQSGCSVRTVQRAITQARQNGLLEVHRAKSSEKPPHVGYIVPCGWSHRWTIGWGQAGEAVKKAVAVAKARWIALHTTLGAPKTAALRRPSERSGRITPTGRRFTAEELDAELERLPPHEPDPAPG